MSNVDILLDMITGSTKDETAKQNRNQASSRKIDFLDYKLNWQQGHSLNATLLSNVLFRLFGKKLVIRKGPKSSTVTKKIKPDNGTIKVFKPHNKIINLWKNALKNHNKKGQSKEINRTHKYNLNDEGIDSVMITKEHQQEFEEDVKPCKLDVKSENSICIERTHALELFFQSLQESVKKFNEDEILELQIQILKSIKVIKGKRDLKQNLRRYCVASMSFNDSLLKSTN